MRIVAALCIGVFAALAVGTLAGVRLNVRFPPRLSSRRGSTQTWLRQAGVPATAAQYRLAVASAVVAAFVAVTALTASAFVAVVPAVAVGLGPRGYLARRRRQRLREVQAAWPDGLRELLASIAAGRSLTQAVTDLATHGPPALQAAFARFPELARVLGTAPALEIVREELADPTSDRIIEVLILAHERGGAIVRSILVDLTEATTRDLKLAEEIDTEGLEMRINARVVVVLPWFVLVALTARPGPFRDFYRTGAGALTLLAGAVLSLVGVVVLGRLGREPDEPRVFGRLGAGT